MLPKPANWFARHKKQFALLVAGTCVGLLTAEIALRLVWHNPYREESLDRIVRLRLRPANASRSINRQLINADQPLVEFRIDDRSYIRPSFQHAAPVVTIGFLGGSTTECFAVQEHLRFPALVSSRMDENGFAVNTLNGARSGNTSHDSINVLLNHMIQDRPNVVVMMHACNDAGVVGGLGSYGSRMGNVVSISDIGRQLLKRFSSDSYFGGLLRNLAINADRNIAIQNPGPRDHINASAALDGEFRKRLRVFTHICRDFEIEPVLMTQPLSSKLNSLAPSWADGSVQDRFNDIVRDVCREESVLLIDLDRYVRTQVEDWERPFHVFYDGMHVTDRGSRIYAEHIVESLKPLVERIANGRR
ncbi:MAG: SGNH/GDSL hydrolase family protein [Planctomycetota bacterium]|nr:SGNH/GDSL hydrolase family protein [Planctomycetota bacterium]